MKTNLLLSTTLLLGLLVAASCNYVPYPEPRRIDQLKIPYCLNQIGFTCQVCGFEPQNKTATAPNQLASACIPSPKGCTKFLDFKGLICDQTAPCYCGFVKNSTMDCTPNTGTPTINAVIDNCAQLDNTNKLCQDCINTKGDTYYGAGLYDYGLSADFKKCLDNSVIVPNCVQYKADDKTCNKCRTGYLFTADGQCDKPLIPLLYCDTMDISRRRCTRCVQTVDSTTASAVQFNYDLTVDEDGMCQTSIYTYNPATPANKIDWNNCLKRKMLNNGAFHQFHCDICEAGYILAQVSITGTDSADGSVTSIIINGCQALPTAAANVIHLLDPAAGVLTDGDLDLFNYCYAYVVDHNSVKVCAVWKSSITNAPIAPVIAQSCNNYNAVLGTCASSADCQTLSVFNTVTKMCSTTLYTCNPNCLQSNSVECTLCQDEYTLIDGRCVAKPVKVPAGVKTWNTTDYTPIDCLINSLSVDRQTILNYYYNPVTKTCDTLASIKKTIDFCLMYSEDFQCTKCQSSYTYNDLNWKCEKTNVVDPTILGGVVGCSTYDPVTGVCTGCVNNLVLLTDDSSTNTNNLLKKCDVIPVAGCARFDTTTSKCTLCSNINHSLFYNANKQWECKNQVAAVGAYCQVAADGCNCSACQVGLGTLSSSKKCPEATPTAFARITNCAEHQADLTVCTLCYNGFLITDDGQCYDLTENHSTSFRSTTTVAVADYEPCSQASALKTCTVCNSKYDAALVTLDSTATGSTAKTFCIINKSQFGLDSSAITGTLSGTAETQYIFPNCKQYTTLTSTTTSFSAVLCVLPTVGFPSKGTGYSQFQKCATFAADGCATCTAGIGNFLYTDSSSIKVCDTWTNCQAVDTAVPPVCTLCRDQWWLNISGQTCNSIYTAAASPVEGTSCSFRCAIKAIVGLDTSLPSPVPTVSCSDGWTLSKTNGDWRCIRNAILNCATIDAITGSCQTCSDGFSLSSDINAPISRSNIMKAFCVPTVTGCILYTVGTGQCTQCGPSAAGDAQYPDEKGNTCISVKNAIPGCSFYVMNDPTKCVQCKVGRGTPENGCKIPVDNCATYDNMYGYCSACIDKYVLTHKNLCVKNILLDDCKIAYNSTQCIECIDAKVLIRNYRNDESDAFGICKDFSSTLPDCILTDTTATVCQRCRYGSGILSGICIPNVEDNFPAYCAEYAYDTNQKSIYCRECERGWAINSDRTLCIRNGLPCTDNSVTDCYVYDKLTQYNVANTCKENRSSSSILAIFILSALMLIISF